MAELKRSLKNSGAKSKGPSRNWRINITTKFPKFKEISKEFIKQWAQMSMNPNISFLLYRFEENTNVKRVGIIVYMELQSNIRDSGLRKILTLVDTVFESFPSVHESKLSIYTFISGSKDKDVFWYGAPRFQNKTVIRSHYTFIMEHELLDKAFSDYSMPAFFKHVLIDEGIILREEDSLDDLRKLIHTTTSFPKKNDFP